MIFEIEKEGPQTLIAKQIQSTDPNTKLFFNKILKDRSPKKDNYSSQISVSLEDCNDQEEGNIKIKNQVQKLLNHLKSFLKKFYLNELKRIIINGNRHNQLRESSQSLIKVFKMKSNNMRPGKKIEIIRLKPNHKMIKFGKSVQKLRNFIAKHFLSISLENLQQYDFANMSALGILNLAKFKAAMLECFPKDSCISLGRKYLQIGLNKYANVYLRKFVVKFPWYAVKLKVYCEEDEEIRIEKIAINQKALIDQGDQTDSPGRIAQVLRKEINIEMFYKKNKLRQLSQKDSKDVRTSAIKEYFDRLDHFQNINIDPRIILRLFNEGTLFIHKQNINIQQARTIGNFFMRLSKDKEFMIDRLISDTQSMNDQKMALLLDGCRAQIQKCDIQGSQIHKLMKSYPLSSFIFINGEIGTQTIERINILADGIIELKFCRLSFPLKLNSQIIFTKLFTSLRARNDVLMKITISWIDIGEDPTIEALCYLINDRKNLQYIDLSNSQLKPRHLLTISETLLKRTCFLRDVNLSYNKLCPSDSECLETDSPSNSPQKLFEMDFQKTNEKNEQANESQKQKQSKQFIANMISLIENSKLLNHINLSGMNMSHNQIKNICISVTQSRLLMGVHLNDNGICTYKAFMNEILDILGLSQEDIPLQRSQIYDQLEILQESKNLENEFFRQSQRNLFRGKLFVEPSQQNWLLKRKINSIYQQVHQPIDYKKMLQPYMRNKYEKSDDDKQTIEEKEKYLQYCLVAEEVKEVELEKVINTCSIADGIGRPIQNQNDDDCFVITRILNHPELCFNQRAKFDFTEPKFRFFQRDASKIEDKNVLEKLRYEYKTNQLEYRNKTPLICGTMIQKRFPKSCAFERKLKMLRTPMFSLLSIIASEHFSKSEKTVFAVKEGCQRFLIYDDEQILQILQVQICFDGWQQNFNDLALNNELTDIKIINFPDLANQNLKKQDWFTFAAIVPTGYQQILIYDPELDRAFVKDFVVHLNQRDFVYPEYPLPLGDPISKIVPNMWRAWVDDTDEDLQKSFNVELEQKTFDINLYIKNPEDANNCLNKLSGEFRKINIFQKSLMVKSTSYPLINWDSISTFIDKIQNQHKFILKYGTVKLSRAQLELSFIRATRNSSSKGLNACLSRSELLDFVMRIAQQFIQGTNKGKTQIADNLNQFFDEFVSPVCLKSPINEHRKIIRGSRKLNELLYDNNKNLQFLFDYNRKYHGQNNYFDREAAKYLFFDISEKFSERFFVDEETIVENFIYSMMTVLNERQNQLKYNYLVFVEFQEFICRLALIGIKELDTIEWKVFYFLELIFDRYYKLGIWDPQQRKIVKINTTVMF